MLVGIMSDSHGRTDAVHEAITLFNGVGVSHVIHCGDVGALEVFDHFLGIPFSFVWGNTDYPDASLLAYLEHIGIKPPRIVPLRLTLDNRTFVVFHGHEPFIDDSLALGKVDYICHGHTHVICNECINGTRIINPGALHRAKRKTVAVLDTRKDQLEFYEIEAKTIGPFRSN